MVFKRSKTLRPLIAGAALVLPLSMIPAGAMGATTSAGIADASVTGAGITGTSLASSGVSNASVVDANLASSGLADANVKTVVVASNPSGDIKMVRYDEDPVEASLSSSWRDFPDTAETVYLVNPYDPAVSVGIVAAVKSQRPGPVLFTDSAGEINERTVAEIGRLRPHTVVAVGGQASVQTSAIDSAVAASQTAHDNLSTEDPVDVTAQTWSGDDAVHTSLQVAQNLYPDNPRRAYLIDADQPMATIMPLAAIAGSVGSGPVVLVNKDNARDVKDTLEAISPEFVVGVGSLDRSLLDAVSGDFKKSSYTGSSITSIALNAASTRAVDSTAMTSLAASDDPASLILAAGSSNGPLVPVAPETSMKDVIATVANANRLTGASSQRFVAIGKEGSRGRIFDPRPTQTLSGGLTSTDVTGKGIGKPVVVEPPEGLTAGEGAKFTYTIEVDEGLPVDADEFAREVSKTLNNPSGWGRNFQQVADPAKADTRIVLASPNLVDELCAPLQTMGQTSCNRDEFTVINIQRWAYGASPFLQAGGTLDEYRQYVISHEVGHALGNGHATCPGRGELAPGMLQQTLDLKGCKTNPWPNP